MVLIITPPPSPLESASNAFHRAYLALSAASRLLVEKSATGRDEADAFAELDRRLETLWEEENRLAVRLGLDDPIFAPFVAGVVQLQEARRVLRSATEDDIDPSEVKRLGDVAILLQHEFWHRAAQQVGPRVGGDRQVWSNGAAERQAVVQPIIDDTLRGFYELPQSAVEHLM